MNAAPDSFSKADRTAVRHDYIIDDMNSMHTALNTSEM
jgi:hypothetical protein